jgi:hypothetical protein
MVANPIATVKGLASLARHPIKSAKMLVTEGVKACRKDSATCIGKLAFEVASTIATGGAAAGTSAGAKGGKGIRFFL